uniref:Uncharacterized protein n=1 Tax=Timema shepardi TaxID=629360 RepID=A0A7R9AQY1_TIMSH|nr:unnamed protein product [Timema shepardi]
METCDNSLVKQEIVELIKTEPQNENEFDMFGQQGIKTEDESDTSNSVDEIVKTEFKLYDSSFGIMDSKIEHFTAVDKSEEDILETMVEQVNVKLKIVLRERVKEEIVLYMEEEGNVFNIWLMNAREGASAGFLVDSTQKVSQHYSRSLSLSF